MNTDHSWEKACQEYIEVYNLIINKIWKLKRKCYCILGGGQGSRLYPLTESRSKPAVPIGKYRLVDILFQTVWTQIFIECLYWHSLIQLL
jgi:CTP:phosphocholine cytidylyltransferase-like protein